MNRRVFIKLSSKIWTLYVFKHHDELNKYCMIETRVKLKTEENQYKTKTNSLVDFQ